jgi:hypothetical protein
MATSEECERIQSDCKHIHIYLGATLPLNVEVIAVNQLANLISALNIMTNLPVATRDTLLDGIQAKLLKAA